MSVRGKGELGKRGVRRKGREEKGRTVHGENDNVDVVVIELEGLEHSKDGLPREETSVFVGGRGEGEGRNER
jgi:hypothetical protein